MIIMIYDDDDDDDDDNDDKTMMIFTDGLALGNPSPTGSGVVINLPKLSLFVAQAMKKK